MTDKNNLLDFQDPGAIGNELLDVPGFVNELKNHTLAVSPRPNAVLAFAGALAMQAHLTGASYTDKRGVSTNLYLAALAPTGMGKEEPRVTNKRLAAEIGILVKRFLGLLAKHGGSLDRRSLLRWLHVDHITFRRIVMTLHMSDEIIEEAECGKTVVYTLKSAA